MTFYIVNVYRDNRLIGGMSGTDRAAMIRRVREKFGAYNYGDNKIYKLEIISYIDGKEHVTTED